MRVKFDKSTILYLEDLTDILIEKKYLSFYESSLNYISDIKDYILNNIYTAPKHKAPPRFSRYGKNMLYITYRRNKQTTWYIFFTVHGKDKYMVRYIINNHVSAQHIRGLK